MSPERTYKRKLIMVEPQFQVRIALWASMLAVVEVLIGTSVVMGFALTSVWIPAGEHSHVFYKFVFVIAAMVVILLLINMTVSLFLSHRIAGPVYRLKQSMRQVGTGDLSFLINLREHDELQELKDEFNDMVNNLRERVLTLEAGNSHSRQRSARKPERSAAKTSAVRAQFKLD